MKKEESEIKESEIKESENWLKKRGALLFALALVAVFAVAIATTVNVSVSEEGINVISYYSTDVAGNVELTKNVSVQISYGKPGVVASYTCSLDPVPYDEYCKDSASVKIEGKPYSAGGVEIPIVAVYYRVNDGEWVEVAGSVATLSLTEKGKNLVEFYSKDEAGNEANKGNVTLFIDKDSDGDSIYDNFDNCPLEYATYYMGCPAAIRVIATNHTIPGKGGPHKSPLVGLPIEVYNLTEIRKNWRIIKASLVNPNYKDNDDEGNQWEEYHKGKIPASKYDLIRNNFDPIIVKCVVPGTNANGKDQCVTNASGEALIGVPVWKLEDDTLVGEFAVVGVSNDTNKLNHLVKFREVPAGKTKKANLELLTTPQGKPVAGKAKTVRGSGELTIIEPDYLVWDSTTEEYVYYLEPTDDWTLNITVTPPEGWVANPPADVIETTAGADTSTVFVLNATGTKADKMETQVTYWLKSNPEKKQTYASIVEIKPVGALKQKVEISELINYIILAGVAVIIIITVGVTLLLKEKKD